MTAQFCTDCLGYDNNHSKKVCRLVKKKWKEHLFIDLNASLERMNYVHHNWFIV